MRIPGQIEASTISGTTIRLKRVYEPAAPDDGIRILVERLWPRGLTKEEAAIDHWAKEVAPSPELRRWFAHRPELWLEFQIRYQGELAANLAEIKQLKSLCADKRITFVFAARDQDLISARILRDFLLEM